jgi:hypothetical protein
MKSLSLPIIVAACTMLLAGCPNVPTHLKTPAPVRAIVAEKPLPYGIKIKNPEYSQAERREELFVEKTLV